MNRKLAVLGVLVTLLGGILGIVGFQAVTTTTSVLAVARPVPAGAAVTEGDLTRVDVSIDPRLRPIPASEMASIVGQTASVELHPGELLTRAQLGAQEALKADQVLVAVPLKEGQFPSTQLAPGQDVTVISVPGSGGAVAGQAAPATSISGTVMKVGTRNDATQVTVVDLRVKAVDGPVVARLASAGQVSLLVVPTRR